VRNCSFPRLAPTLSTGKGEGYVAGICLALCNMDRVLEGRSHRARALKPLRWSRAVLGFDGIGGSHRCRRQYL